MVEPISSRIAISARVKRAIEELALGACPAECCGLLSGDGHKITELHPLRNQSPQPETKYFAAPEDLFAAMRRIRQSGQVMMGIYHSHPSSPAYPSAADVEMAFYPDALYFIISLEPHIELRAFKIEGSKVEEVTVVVI
jgi:proteasome lid subunit RPN8/RPN11